MKRLLIIHIATALCYLATIIAALINTTLHQARTIPVRLVAFCKFDYASNDTEAYEHYISFLKSIGPSVDGKTLPKDLYGMFSCGSHEERYCYFYLPLNAGTIKYQTANGEIFTYSDGWITTPDSQLYIVDEDRWLEKLDQTTNNRVTGFMVHIYYTHRSSQPLHTNRFWLNILSKIRKSIWEDPSIFYVSFLAILCPASLCIIASIASIPVIWQKYRKSEE